MATRRRFDPSKLRAQIEDERANLNRDDDDPWFVARYLQPPDCGEVRAIWPDGLIGAANFHEGKWHNHLWCSHRVARTEPPVGWKPPGMFQRAHASGKWDPLPNPLDYGIRVT